MYTPFLLGGFAILTALAVGIAFFYARKAVTAAPALPERPPEATATDAGPPFPDAFMALFPRIASMEADLAQFKRRLTESEEAAEIRHRQIMARLSGMLGGRGNKRAPEPEADDERTPTVTADSNPDLQALENWQALLASQAQGSRPTPANGTRRLVRFGTR